MAPGSDGKLQYTQYRAKAALAILIVGALSAVLRVHPPAFPAPLLYQQTDAQKSPGHAAPPTLTSIRVTVTGEVERAGDMTFVEGTTLKGLFEAVRPKPTAYVAHADYTYLLQDGDEIHIPSKLSDATSHVSLSDDSLLRIRVRSRPKFVSAEEMAESAHPKLNVNSATLDELQTLPRIGPETARRIIEAREKRGGFRRKEELMNIRGIGKKTYKWLEPLISVE